MREQRQLLNHLEFLSNESRIPIITMGTTEASYAMQTDPQIASRFEAFALPRWHESPGLREFVVSFGRLPPLHRPFPFGDQEMIRKVMACTGGLTGRITGMLSQAAELAIRQGTESISLDLLDQAIVDEIFKLPNEETDDEATARIRSSERSGDTVKEQAVPRERAKVTA
ncbi:MAG: TniB family NTP-binding protein [Burkholderiaceae bacterium]